MVYGPNILPVLYSRKGVLRLVPMEVTKDHMLLVCLAAWLPPPSYLHALLFEKRVSVWKSLSTGECIQTHLLHLPSLSAASGFSET